MGLHKNGVSVQCERCRFAGEHAGGAFEVRVPVRDQAGGFAGNARVRCQVSVQAHQLTLIDLGRVQAGAPVSAEVLQRVQGVLDHVAAHRVCGNERLCPAEVVAVCHREGGDAD